MPWKESDKVSERMQFISRHLEGERISDLSREFGISRQTGHALVKRYKQFGPDALRDTCSRPHRSPNRTPKPKVEAIVGLRLKHPTWGPKKLKSRLEVLEPDVRWPAASTIGAILADAGLNQPRRRRRKATPNVGTDRRETSAPNELWCIDFKGQFRLGNRSYCYPLTVTDHFSRYLIGCDALESTRTAGTQTALWAAFGTYGLPQAIRSDNGSPFASTGRLGMSRLSVQLVRLGIELERIEPGKPQQNGRHEGMHLTLKQDTTRPPAHSVLAQQEKFDVFRGVFNAERPHEAIQMKTPDQLYTSSAIALPERISPVTYPLHDQTCHVQASGHFHFPGGNGIYLGRAWASQDIGLRQIETGTWPVSFASMDVGYLDAHTRRIIDLPNDQTAHE